MPTSITLRSLRKRLGYVRGILTEPAARSIGVAPGYVHFLPRAENGVTYAASVYRGQRLGGRMLVGMTGVLPLPSADDTIARSKIESAIRAIRRK